MHRTRIGLCDCEQRLTDHTLEHILRHGQTHPVADRRDLRIFRSGDADDGEFRLAAADGGVELVVRGQPYRLVGQPTYDFAEQLGA